MELLVVEGKTEGRRPREIHSEDEEEDEEKSAIRRTRQLQTVNKLTIFQDKAARNEDEKMMKKTYINFP